MATKKKTSAKKAPPKKAPTKKAPVKKPVAKKPVPKKPTPPVAKGGGNTIASGTPNSTITTTGNTPVGTFTFANPTSTGDNYADFTKAEIFADTNAQPSQVLQPVPAPWKTPPVLELSDVIGAAAVAQIETAGSLTFHSVGDTGGIHNPAAQFAVADAMVGDLAGKTYAVGRPAFFYHLGDVVYDLGQELYYYEQFYDPYRNYDAPIIAIAGNHDGMVSPTVKQSTLQGFTENFCTQTPSKNPEAQGFARTTMTQPGVYFTFSAPFIDFVGLYSNIGDGTVQGTISGGVVGTAQLSFLQQQLTAIAAARRAGTRKALVIAVHHPPFTGSADHSPSPAMLKDMDGACTAAGIQPDMVLSGHSHLYERYTRTVGGAQIPFVVAGMGGYWNLSGMKTDQNSQPPNTPLKGTDTDGNPLVLETYNAKTFGYMKMTVNAAVLQCTVYGVTQGTGGQAAQVSELDTFTLDLVKHVVS